MQRCDMRYSMVIESSNERLAQRLSCSSVIAIEIGESFISAASCLSAHPPPIFLSLATISWQRLRGEAAIYVLHHTWQGGRSRILGEFRDDLVDFAVGIRAGKIGGTQRRLQVVDLRARYIGIDDARPQRIRRPQAMAGQRQERAQRARQARQEITAADVGKEA